MRPVIYEHALTPDWGRGTLLETRDGKAVLMFENAGRKVLLQSALPKLKVVDLPHDEIVALDARLRGRRVTTDARTGKTKVSGTSAVTPFASFNAQLAAFEKAYPGGFEGERFLREERGEPGAKVTAKGNRAQAVALAQQLLAPEAFSSQPADKTFADVVKLFQTAKLVHPLEGGLAITTLAAELKPSFVAALGELLHGAGDEAARLDRFIEAIQLKDTHGEPVRVSWPLATFLPAIYRPAEHVCVKPTAFRCQASLVGVEVDYQSRPSAHVYAQFLALAKATHDKLAQAQKAPRDLVDTAAFIVATHAATKAKAK
jgi:hypothetical protein